MPITTRELLAKLIKCEAGGEGDNGMRAVASVIVNRAQVPNGEFARVSHGGDIRAIIEQQNQFTCMKEAIGGAYNAQNVWNMDPLIPSVLPIARREGPVLFSTESISTVTTPLPQFMQLHDSEEESR